MAEQMADGGLSRALYSFLSAAKKCAWVVLPIALVLALGPLTFVGYFATLYVLLWVMPTACVITGELAMIIAGEGLVMATLANWIIIVRDFVHDGFRWYASLVDKAVKAFISQR